MFMAVDLASGIRKGSFFCLNASYLSGSGDENARAISSILML